MASSSNPGALKQAAAEGKLDVVKELIEKQGVSPDQPDEFGDTALHSACQNGRDDVVKYLLDKGANPNAVNKTGSTPLHKLVASKYEQKPILKRLLAAKANPNIRNNAGLLPEQLVRNKNILLELLRDEAITETVDVPKARHGRVIGKGGQKMSEIRDETHCIISVPDQSDNSTLITVVGRKEGVEKAKALIKEAVEGPKQNKEEEETAAVTVKYPLAKELYKFVIGKGGKTINEIRDETGVQIIVPKLDEADGTITLKGEQDDIDQALKRIREVTLAGSKPANGSPRGGGPGRGAGGDRRGSRDNNNNNSNFNEGRRGSNDRRGGNERRGSSDRRPQGERQNLSNDGTPQIQFMGVSQPPRTGVPMNLGEFLGPSASNNSRSRGKGKRGSGSAPAGGSESPAPSTEAEGEK